MPEHSTPTTPAGPRSAGSAAGTAGAFTHRPAGESLPAATDARLQTAVEAVTSGRFSVLSLDCFDTLLWRKVPEPVNAFFVLGAQLQSEEMLAPDIDGSAFALLRQRAEVRARTVREESGCGGEVTLREICSLIPPGVLRMGLDELMQREVEVERGLLVADLDVVEVARLAGEKGMRVVCVSDTYFSETHMRSFLAGPPTGSLDIARVFASSSYRAGKAGGLWRHVIEELGVKPKQIVHVGDNHDADVAAAARNGIQGVYFERRPEGLARMIHREDAHAGSPLSPYHGDYGLTALRSKVLHRLEGARQPVQLQPFWSFGAASLGPPLTGFADWVQERTAAAGASKAFCMMREGRLLAELVNAAAASVSSPVEAEPIWLSRQVCARASMVEGTAEELSSLFERRRMPSVAEFCATLGIDSSEVPGFEHMPDARLHQPGMPERLTEQIMLDPELRARVVAQSAELRGRVVRYLEKMCPPGEGRLVLVDLGWGATIQTLADRLLRQAGSELRTTGLYLITTNRAAERMIDGADVHGYLANAGRPSGPVDAFMRSPELLEQICMPDHGSQIGLDADLGPILESAEQLPVQSAQREAVQKGVAAFQREWVRYRTTTPHALVPLHEYGQDRLRSILVRAMTAPTVDEAALFAGWLHDENFGSAGLDPLVCPTSARAARYLEPWTLLKAPMTDIYWPFGLAALHDEHLARAVEAVSTGLVPWEGFSSPLETGPVEIFCDRGWGFRREGMVVARPRRNRAGLSYARGTVAGDAVRRVRVDLAKSPCVLRIDWLRLRCHLRDSGAVRVLDFDRPAELASLKMRGMRKVGPNSYLVRSGDPHVVVEVQALSGAEVHTVNVECGFAVLALPASGLKRGTEALKERLRERTKGGRLGAPLRAAYALLRRID
jgi:FMN phosphatase YigB (HAD superfamily)